MPVRYLVLESLRQLRNVRSIVFTFLIPLMLLLVFGSIYGGSGQIDPVTGLPWLIITTVQMAAYGGMMAALSQAFAITTERATGWNRQLRITPLGGLGYLVSKVIAALLIAGVTVVLLCGVSIVVLGARLDPLNWLLAIVGIWVGTVPFALIAVAVGQFAKPEYAQPVFLVVFFAMAVVGGLWIPLSIMPAWVTDIAKGSPSFWLDRLGQMGAHGTGNVGAPLIVLTSWTVVFGLLVVWRYRRDAARA